MRKNKRREAALEAIMSAFEKCKTVDNISGRQALISLESLLLTSTESLERVANKLNHGGYELRLVEGVIQLVKVNSVPIENPGLILFPGYKLAKCCEFIFSKKDYERIIEPLISDWLEEWTEATIDNNLWKARWLQCRYLFAFCYSIISIIGVKTVKTIIEVAKIK